VAVAGDTVVVGARDEASNATGVNGNQSDNSASLAGAAYVFISPEIAVLGNRQVIADGDASPDTGDDTDFGSALISGGQITRTFTISNSGAADLTLTGTPVGFITGPAAGDFSAVSNPTTPVLSNTTTTFQVRFSPSVTGTRVATLTIANNDANENPYDFAIQGSGTSVSTQTVYLPLIFK